MTRYAALPRSINAGKPLAMTALRALVADCGYHDVATLLASGNGVFTADEDGGAIERRLAAAALAIGLDTDWFVRSHPELADIAAHLPFSAEARDHPSWVAVHFFVVPVDARPLDGYAGPERWAVRGRELYVDYAEGMGRSKLAPRLGRLGVNTARNWNTLLKLVTATA